MKTYFKDLIFYITKRKYLLRNFNEKTWCSAVLQGETFW